LCRLWDVVEPVARDQLGDSIVIVSPTDSSGLRNIYCHYVYDYCCVCVFNILLEAQLFQPVCPAVLCFFKLCFVCICREY